MSSTLSKSRSTSPLIVLSGTPRVNLLPPAVKRREKERRDRRLLAVVVFAVVAGVAAAGVGVNQHLATEHKKLASLQVESAALQAKERDYASAAAVSAATARITKVREFVGKSDILWVPFLSSVEAAVAPDAAISSTSSVSAVSWVAAPAVVVPLAPASVATSSIVISFASLDKLAPVVQRLLDVRGVVAATPGALTQTGAAYSTTISLSLGTEAFSNRFTTIRVKGAE